MSGVCGEVICSTFYEGNLMKQATTYGSSGRGIVGLLGVLFVALKLLGVIDWSWLWVTAPFWGGLAIVALLLAVFFVLKFVLAFIAMIERIRSAR